MTAIYKKELKSYLTSMVGYLFMAFTQIGRASCRERV